MTAQLREFHVDAAQDGSRLDRCLAQLIPDCSRNFLQELIRQGQVRCNDVVVTSARHSVHGGMKISLALPEVRTPELQLSVGHFDYQILYEDEVMLVIDKPSGVVVHPGAGNGDGTIVNALLERYSDFAARFEKNCGRPGIVHRLDKDTSGCLVIAKTPEAMFKLSRAFSERRTHKLYWALLKNQPAQAAGTIENLLGRHPVNRQKMAVVERNGRTAVTKYRVRQTGKLAGHPVALVEFEIFTGRTHQIRVHASQCLNCPVLGDALYGGRVPLVHVPRQMLHARQLTLPHPVSGVELTFTSPLPADFQALLAQITEA